MTHVCTCMFAQGTAVVGGTCRKQQRLVKFSEKLQSLNKIKVVQNSQGLVEFTLIVATLQLPGGTVLYNAS